MTAKLFNVGPFAFTPFDKLPSWYLSALLADHAEGVKWSELDNETKEALQKEAKARAVAGGVPGADLTTVAADGSTVPVEEGAAIEQAVDPVSGETFDTGTGTFDNFDAAPDVSEPAPTTTIHTSPVPEPDTPSPSLDTTPNLDSNPDPADSTESEKDGNLGDSADETASAKSRSTRHKR